MSDDDEYAVLHHRIRELEKQVARWQGEREAVGLVLWNGMFGLAVIIVGYHVFAWTYQWFYSSP